MKKGPASQLRATHRRLGGSRIRPTEEHGCWTGEQPGQSLQLPWTSQLSWRKNNPGNPVLLMNGLICATGQRGLPLLFVLAAVP